ncbi:solute:Na+ symporter, SSS family [Pseudonocardia thermophila]|jgi:Na+/proline symporter|uniref:Solute:Na+ symporter, SSS family n=1 Tax=Pseudonocardia thermophila TaxID=1848 RepID=A0A1M6T5Y7_PSETH|nr:sodium:solute symporter [Pseudonocardia thermophila]SHK52324.1 solute:Na+ symporter, SSS family [Pseudonocardia thermophila]
MIKWGETLAFVGVLLAASALAVTARRLRPIEKLPDLPGWALADRSLGPVTTWFLLGGSIFTAYTFAAVPGLVYAAGAIGFFPFVYTALLCPVLFVLLPRLWRAARDAGAVTVADWVRHRYGSPALMLAVALTGVLATMPYIALQLIGVRAVLIAGGLYPPGLVGDLALTAVFAVLAVATYRSGLRAPTVIAFFKGVLIFTATIGVLLVVLHLLGGPDAALATAERRLGATTGRSLFLDPELGPAFVSLAVGSALALPMYPHVLTAAFAADGPAALRRASVAMPAWTMLLGLFSVLAVAALAAGITAPPGRAEVAVPMLVSAVVPAEASGIVFGALVVGALVPAAVMSVAVAALFTRNVYVPFFHPTATPKHEVRVSRMVSLLVKFAAIGFVFGLREQDSINLQLLGGVWILQTMPAVVLGLVSSWWHRHGLLAGWLAGMVTGTVLVVVRGFTSVVAVGSVLLYVALVALAVNLAVAAVATIVLRRRGSGAVMST